MRKRFACVATLCVFFISCNFGGGFKAEAPICEAGELNGKDAVLYTGGLVFNEVVIPAAVYVDSEDGMVHVVWIEPDDSVSGFGGVQVSYSHTVTKNNTPEQKVEKMNYGKGANNPKSGHYHAYLFEKKYPDDYERLKEKPNKEQDVPIFRSTEYENMVINLRAFDEYLNLGPMSTVVSVIEIVSTNKALGRGYNVADNDKFLSMYYGGQVIDILKLKNWNKYSMGEIQLDETEQSHISSDKREDFIEKYMKKETKNFKAGVSTSILKTAFKLNFEKSFTKTTNDNKTTNTKDFYSLYAAKVTRLRQRVLEQYASPDTLRDFLTPQFKEDINNPNITPQRIFETYGTHVMLDIELGGRLEIRLSSNYSSEETTKNAEQSSSELIVAVTKGKESVDSDTVSYSTTDVYATVEAHGGISIPFVVWDGSAFSGNITNWSQSIGNDQTSCVLIDSPSCLDNEDWSTGIWLYADSLDRQKEIKEAYLQKLYGNYASLVSGPYRTKNDGLYVKSFGFVTVCNPSYPNGRIAGDDNVVSSDGFIYLDNSTQTFGDFDAERLREAALIREHARGNTDVHKNDIVFFSLSGVSSGNKIFKIVDARRNLYSDPLSSDKSASNYSVRLSSLRYPHSSDRPFDAANDFIQGYVFYYPYKVLTTNPDEAIYGLISNDLGKSPEDTVSLSSSDYNDVEHRNSLFANYGLEGVCHDYGSEPVDSMEKSKKQSAANSWKVASDYVFNVLRHGDGRYSENGKGDILENPVDLGDFPMDLRCPIPGTSEDYWGHGYNVSKSYKLCDVGFCDERSKLTAHYDTSLQNAIARRDHDACGGLYDTATYCTTYFPFRRDISIDENRWWDALIYTGYNSLSVQTYMFSYYDLQTPVSDTVNDGIAFRDGMLFNTLYPGKFPFSGQSNISPSVLYVSNMMDEKGNLRNSAEAKPIQDIDFIFCKTCNPDPNSPEDSLTNTRGFKWEIVDFPVGAGEWKMLDSFETVRKTAVFDITYKFNDIKNDMMKYKDGAYSNYFTKFTDAPEEKEVVYGRQGVHYANTATKNRTLDKAANDPFDRIAQNTVFYNQKRNAMVLTANVRDMDRYDIYIRYRR